ncbi:MAG TPA: hypothetical protein VE986_03180 [Hyphomicrobiales bacterium]|nr:hypothetical protein [Hyphomicrobiales bacterium]
MAWYATISHWWNRFFPVFILILVVACAIALVEYVPARGAAALLGILAGACISYALSRARLTVQIAVLWAAIAVAADAAYARLNDQAPVTLASALTKVVDAVTKLADPLIRGLGLAAGDPRAKVAAVAPDFVWALILSMIALTSFTYIFPAGSRR